MGKDFYPGEGILLHPVERSSKMTVNVLRLGVVADFGALTVNQAQMLIGAALHLI